VQAQCVVNETWSVSDLPPEHRPPQREPRDAEVTPRTVPRPLLIGLIVLGALMLAAPLAYGVQRLVRGDESHTVRGSFTLTEPLDERPGSDCAGEGGYSDVDQGLDVVVRDGSGDTLGTSALGPGVGVSLTDAFLGEDNELGVDPDEIDLGDLDVAYCRFAFEVEDVPKADFYSIEVGSRGDLNYSYDDLKEKDWTVAFSLGD
jgi:hypothetical protein